MMVRLEWLGTWSGPVCVSWGSAVGVRGHGEGQSETVHVDDQALIHVRRIMGDGLDVFLCSLLT